MISSLSADADEMVTSPPITAGSSASHLPRSPACAPAALPHHRNFGGDMEQRTLGMVGLMSAPRRLLTICQASSLREIMKVPCTTERWSVRALDWPWTRFNRIVATSSPSFFGYLRSRAASAREHWGDRVVDRRPTSRLRLRTVTFLRHAPWRASGSRSTILLSCRRCLGKLVRSTAVEQSGTPPAISTPCSTIRGALRAAMPTWSPPLQTAASSSLPPPPARVHNFEKLISSSSQHESAAPVARRCWKDCGSAVERPRSSAASRRLLDRDSATALPGRRHPDRISGCRWRRHTLPPFGLFLAPL